MGVSPLKTTNIYKTLLKFSLLDAYIINHAYRKLTNTMYDYNFKNIIIISLCFTFW